MIRLGFGRFENHLRLHGKAESKSRNFSVKTLKSKKYSKTLNLPKTNFPLSLREGAAARRELKIQKVCGFSELYDWQKEQDRSATFVLHDGPPYANGNPHVGHALNKILKDITNRYKLLQGYKVIFRPGWDCHGLPIELKALAKQSHEQLQPLQVRKKAKDFALKAIHAQKMAFKRWGIMGDWANCYHTFDPGYQAEQLKVFCTLYEKGLIHQDFMPVYWSPSSRTALAEAELEYNTEHISTSLWLRFPVFQIPDVLANALGCCRNLFLLVWTTTPWTVPANQAVCYNDNIRYCCVGDHTTAYICAEEFVPKLVTIFGKQLQTIFKFQGISLQSMTYKHPLTGVENPVVAAGHVKSDKGTGLIHTAPAYGHDDFHMAVKYGLQITNLVDENGCYVTDAGPELTGKKVGEDADKTVIELLGNHVVKVESIQHSYPYDWRTKQPVIIRASKQWFINTKQLRNQALDCLQNVNILPKSSENGMVSQLNSRTYWCISRQRLWGLPIPVFYHKLTGTPLIHRECVEHIIRLFVKHGTDCWWVLSERELLPDDIVRKLGMGTSEDYIKGTDILDIWFDSGTSWAAVLKDENYQADVYLEGLDQFGGWFQSSLLTCVAANGKPPYHSIIVHGFAVDENGQKMSKSLGNVVDPADVINGSQKQKLPSYGADILRWWAAGSGLQMNIMIGPKMLNQCNEEVFMLRKRCRFLLGNLFDFIVDEHQVNYDFLLLQDKYMLHHLYNFIQQIVHHYETFNYSKVLTTVEKFVNTKVSNFYSTVIKDRCYCDNKASVTRRSSQTVQHHLVNSIAWAVAPILPHLAEELFQNIPRDKANKGLNSIFKSERFQLQESWNNHAIWCQLQPVLNIKDVLNSQLSPEDPLEFDVIVYARGNLYSNLKSLQPAESSFTSTVTEILQASCTSIINKVPLLTSEDAIVVDGATAVYQGDNEPVIENYEILIIPAERHICDRCRRYTVISPGLLCDRCATVIAEDWA